MKKNIKIYGLLLACLFFLTGLAAQQDSSACAFVEVAMNKTTSIIFPRPIISADRGSRDVLLQKLPAAENILQLKAAAEGFPETNVTVVTAGGRLYSFPVRYAAVPRLVVMADSAGSVFERVLQQQRFIRHCRDNSYGITIRLLGIYVEKNMMFFSIKLENSSAIGYDIDLFQFTVKDKKQGRRTASQELPQVPLQVYGNTGRIEAMTSQLIAVALPAFTIPGKKHFYIALAEKNGGRNLRLRISNRTIVHARPLGGT